MKRKLKTLAIVLPVIIIASLAMLTLTGCGFSGEPLTDQSQLYGRWRLQQNSYTAGFGRFTNSVGAGTPYFIELNQDGSFTKRDFWGNVHGFGTVSGTWTFHASTSILALSNGVGRTRNVYISNDGSQLQFTFDHGGFSYRNRYVRV